MPSNQRGRHFLALKTFFIQKGLQVQIAKHMSSETLNSSNNVILSACTGYGLKELKPFLLTAGKHCNHKNTTLVLFCDRATLNDASQILSIFPKTEFIDVSDPLWIKILANTIRSKPVRALRSALRPLFKKIIHKKQRCSSISILDRSAPDSYDQLPGHLNIMIARLFYAGKWLKEHRGKFRRALLTDCRDVIFQGDPFKDSSHCLCAGQESILIGSNAFTVISRLKNFPTNTHCVLV